MTILLKFLLGIGAIYVLLLAFMFFRQGHLLFMPDTRSYSQKDVNVDGYTDITVQTQDDLILRGWYSAARPGKKTIVMFHGNASTWQWRASDFLTLVREGYGVLLAGYRGYGGNPGIPSEQGFYQDAQAYLDFLTQKMSTPYSEIVLYGESLGTGVAIEMAHRHADLAGLILEAPYTSIADLTRHHYPYVLAPDFLLKNQFASIYKIGALMMPKLFFVAEADKVVPAQFAHTLYDQTPQPKQIKIFKGAEHTDMRQMGALNDVVTFLKTLD